MGMMAVVARISRLLVDDVVRDNVDQEKAARCHLAHCRAVLLRHSVISGA